MQQVSTDLDDSFRLRRCSTSCAFPRVFQGQEIVADGKTKATWFVVPGSETDDLSGLRDEGGFEGSLEKDPWDRSTIGSNKHS